MQIAQKIAGFSFGGADIMRRAIAKKKLSVLEQQRDIFLHGGKLEGDKTGKYVPGAVANGVSEEIAREAMRLAMHKLPIKCKFVTKEGDSSEN